MNRYLSAVLVVLTLALTGLGLVMISSTTATVAAGGSASKLVRQLSWLGVAIAVFGITGWIDYKAWRPMAWAIFGITLFAMLMVHMPVLGMKIKGSSRWVRLGPVQVQPSEIMRLALTILLADGLARHQTRIREMKWGLVWPLVVLAPVVALLLKEPDLGTAALVLACTLAMTYVAGARLLPLLGVGVAGAAGVATMVALLPERLDRFQAWWNAVLHPELQQHDGKYYQIWQSLLALGNGGLEGLGLGKSRFKMRHLPEAATDAILPIIGEELGFYASLAILLAYVTILICGILIARRAREVYGLLLGFGLVFGLCLQAAINVGTFTGCFPPKGMPLPFISYGGSNLALCYASIGLLVSIHRQSLRAHRFRAGLPADEETPLI
ncbi:MAG: FtsW/RodA/SpoVE family cell cycle protein [Verrucomicrobiae bacterium]|nr:FtsW/RodA/SpoVE family cell cycle protein [Verrucomicrobiae bacterium]